MTNTINQTRSKVFKLAHALKSNNQFLSFSDCLKKSWAVVKLQEAMKVNVMDFVFQKVNGELRTAKGTLKADLINYQSKGTGRQTPITQVRYFDIEKGAFRSFRAERLISTAA